MNLWPSMDDLRRQLAAKRAAEKARIDHHILMWELEMAGEWGEDEA